MNLKQRRSRFLCKIYNYVGTHIKKQTSHIRQIVNDEDWGFDVEEIESVIYYFLDRKYIKMSGVGDGFYKLGITYNGITYVELKDLRCGEQRLSDEVGDVAMIEQSEREQRIQEKGQRRIRREARMRNGVQS